MRACGRKAVDSDDLDVFVADSGLIAANEILIANHVVNRERHGALRRQSDLLTNALSLIHIYVLLHQNVEACALLRLDRRLDVQVLVDHVPRDLAKLSAELRGHRFVH